MNRSLRDDFLDMLRDLPRALLELTALGVFLYAVLIWAVVLGGAA
jgi:hypothetical protein